MTLFLLVEIDNVFKDTEVPAIPEWPDCFCAKFILLRLFSLSFRICPGVGMCRWVQGGGSCRRFTGRSSWFAGSGSWRAARLPHLPCHAGHARRSQGNCYQVRSVSFGFRYPLPVFDWLIDCLFVCFYSIHWGGNLVIAPWWGCSSCERKAARAVQSCRCVQRFGL